MQVTFTTGAPDRTGIHRGRRMPLELSLNSARESGDMDMRWTIEATANVRVIGRTWNHAGEMLVEDIEITGIVKTEVSWSKDAGYRDIEEDHDGVNPDALEYLNRQLSEERDDWRDVLELAAVAEFMSLEPATI